MAPNKLYFQTLYANRRRRIEKLLGIPCGYCGAATGNPCTTRTGLEIWTIGQMHAARLGGKSARYRRFIEDRDARA